MFYLLMFVGITIGISQEIQQAQAQDELDLSLQKLVGTSGIGNKISGKFKATVSSSIELVNIVLKFNDTIVNEVNDSSMSFTFNTEDYGIGLMNITAIGKDLVGNSYQDSLIRDFMNPTTANLIGISIGAVALLISGTRFIYRKYYKDRKKNEKSSQDKLDSISIDSKF